MDDTGSSIWNIIDITGYVPEHLHDDHIRPDRVLFVNVMLEDTGYIVAMSPNLVLATRHDILAPPTNDTNAFIEKNILLSDGKIIEASPALNRTISSALGSRGKHRDIVLLSFQQMSSIMKLLKTGLQNAVAARDEFDQCEDTVLDREESDDWLVESNTDPDKSLDEMLAEMDKEIFLGPEPAKEPAGDVDELLQDPPEAEIRPIDAGAPPSQDDSPLQEDPGTKIRIMMAEVHENVTSMAKALQQAQDPSSMEELGDVLDLVSLIHSEMGLSRTDGPLGNGAQTQKTLSRAMNLYRWICLHHHQRSFMAAPPRL